MNRLDGFDGFDGLKGLDGFDGLDKLDLPAGQLVGDEHGPLVWLSDEAPSPELMARLRSRHGASGLWPVLVGTDPNDTDTREPADYPEHIRPMIASLYPRLRNSLGAVRPNQPGAEPVDVDLWPAESWAEELADHEDDMADIAALAPRGTEWPGPAPAAEALGDPAAVADSNTARILEDGWLGRPRLALLPGATGGAGLAAARWVPGNAGDFEGNIAVLRTWEERFGARVVALRHDTLFLSVAAPPMTEEHCVHVACEHLAFNPDIVWQCSDSFEEHAESLMGAPMWSFWWD